MLTLGLESSAKAASCALEKDGALVAQYFQNCGLTHSRTLLPMVEALLKNTDTPLSAISRVAVSCGPGSFTGVRIGVATVKGLCWASGLPAAGVSTLKAMAQNGLAFGEGALVCCCMDARRSQIYNALFEIGPDGPVRLCPDRAIALAELGDELKNCQKPIFIVGDGALLCYNYLSGLSLPCRLAPEPLRHQNAFGVCLAARAVPDRPAAELLPVYLRLSQAERERQQRLN